MSPDAYAVWDTETGQWWETCSYGSISAAKNSWNAANGCRYRRGSTRFNDQQRYIVRPVRFTPLDIE